MHRRNAFASRILVAAIGWLICGSLAAQPPANPIPNPGVGPAAPALQPPGGNGVALPPTVANPIPQLDSTVRIKDISFVQGERVNHVNGQGLVFGLSGTGGVSQQTRAMAANYYLRSGLRVDQVDTVNMSSVLVSGKIPAFARPGETILVTVSVADDAESLRGGTLHQTALRGLDDEIYAIAQGPIIGGGLTAGGDAASVQVNHPTVGVCEAIVERAINCGGIVQNGHIHLILRNKSYATAIEVENALNRTFPSSAKALNASTIRVRIPQSFLESVPV